MNRIQLEDKTIYMFVAVLNMIKHGLLKLAKLGLLLMLLGIIFQRRLFDSVKDLPPPDSRLNRGQTRFNSPCLLGLSLTSVFLISI